MTPQQLAILQHALGADRFGRRTREAERNRFVTSSDGEDGLVCQSLVAMGLMVDRGNYGEISGGCNVYVATGDGINAVLCESPAPPKKTKSEIRYETFLRWSDACGGTFREFLKTEYARV